MRSVFVKLIDLPAFDQASGLANVVVETPRGSRCKYRYEAESNAFYLDKMLPLGTYFPHAFGFVPSTRAEDGDPLDMLVLVEEPLAMGCVVTVQLLGVLQANQQEKPGLTVRNDRLIGAVRTKYNVPMIQTGDALGEQHWTEIEHFFVSYNEMEGRRFEPIARAGAETAKSLIEAAIRARS